ncbi:PAS domain S-box-containing protein [Silvimonas terrae]|uniref:histidine kinase n=1 Tax=Silvimonas terrae TaxID=300266 RepID=A0A840RC84_9NEIS|nr:PAS domain S-box protein [Silvimonas terrae]MBB5190003.1 PAS domain S-box-containing protein [Silvimonas terrae]
MEWPFSSRGQSVPRQSSLRPMRVGLVSFYVILLAGCGLVLAWLTLRDYDASLDEARRQNLLLARSLDEQTTRTFISAEQAIQGAVDRLEVAGGVTNADPQDISRELRSRLRLTPQVSDIVTVDEHGMVHSSGAHPGIHDIDYSDRAWLQYHRDSTDPRFLVSSPVLGKVSDTWMIPVSHRVDKPDGSFGGVVAAGIQPEYFNRFYRSLKLPAGTHIKLLRSDGILLLNYPLDPRELGRNMRASDATRFDQSRQNHGAFYTDNTQPGNEKLVTFLVSEGELPMIVMVTSDLDVVLEKFHSDLLGRTVSALLLILVVSALLFLLLRQIRRVEQIESRLYLTQFTVDEAPDVILWADRQAFVRYANRAASAITGYHHEELLRMRFLDLYPHITDPQWQEFWQRLRLEKRMVHITHQRNQEGALQPVEITFNYVEFFQEAYICSTVRDITEQQNSERELRRHRDHLQDLVLERTAEIRTVLDASPLAIMLSVRNTIRLVNPAFEILFGYAASDIIGLPTRVIHASEARYNELATTIWARINTGGVFRGEIELFRRDHSGFWAMLYAKALVPGDPSKGMILVIEDVTAQRIAAQALRQSERLKRTIIDTTADGFILIDTHHHIVDVNHAFCQVLGLRREDLIGEQPAVIWGEPADRIFPASLSNESPSENRLSEVTLIDANGEPLPFLVSSAAILDDQHRLEYAFAFLTNISHLKDIERRLMEARDAAEEANISKSAFLANMSHELRTPMHAILSFSEMGISKAQRGEPGALARYFERIHSSGNRLLVLLNDLLDMSRLEANKMRYDKSRHCLQVAVQGAAAEIAPLLSAQNLRLDIEEDTPALYAVFDQARLMQVVVNLLSNAIKFSPPDGVIEIRFLGEASMANGVPGVGLTVRDHGPGIPDGELESIFDKFIQSTRVRAEAGGTGLGLAISKQIMEDHNGSVSAANHPDGGAVFTVLLQVEAQVTTTAAG